MIWRLFRPLGLAAAIVAACWSLPVIAANRDAEAAAAQFVLLSNERRLRAPEGREMMAGEIGRTFAGDSLGPGLAPPDRVVATGRGQAVARIPAGPAGNPDIYLYLRQVDGEWRVEAVRLLALTGVVEFLGQELAALPSRSAEQEAMLRNLRLTLAPDRELIAWSQRHRTLLEQARAAPESRETAAALARIGARHALREGDRVRVSIGGVLDNEVGFLFAPDGVPPAVDPNEYIWIEDAGGGWFLFKTT